MQYLPSLNNYSNYSGFAQTFANQVSSSGQNSQSYSDFEDYLEEEAQKKADDNAYFEKMKNQALDLQERINKNNGLSSFQNVSELTKNAKELMSEFEKSVYDLAEEGEENSLAAQFLSPYSMHDEVNISSGNVRFNQEEIKELIENMRADGYNNLEVLTAIQDAGKTIDGSTSDYLLQTALSTVMGEEQNLTKLEEQKLLGLSQKLMSSSQTPEEVYNALTSQTPEGILDFLSSEIEKKGSLTLSTEEFGALTTLLQLSDAEKTKLGKMFEGVKDLTVSKTDFEFIMSSARNEITRKKDDLTALTNTLATNLQTIEDKARSRMEAELNAENLTDKRTSVTKAMMEDTHMEEILTSFKENGLKNDALLHEMRMLQDNKTLDAKLGTKNTLAQGLENTLKSAISFTSETGKESFSDNTPKEQKQSLTFTNQNVNQAMTSQNMAKVEAGKVGYDSTILSQVQNAITTAAKGNIQKLEVQLNPVELGALNVVLTSKNGEVNALIQPERLETMHAINQQIDVIKRELEGQGIKFENIEVELQSDTNEYAQHQESQQFEGEQQQQQQAMQQQVDDLNRLRVLGRGINEGWIDKSALSEDELELAQNLLQESEGLIFDKENSSYLNLVA